MNLGYLDNGGITVRANGRRKGMTLVEIMIAVALFALVFGSILAGLKLASNRALFAKYSAAANKLAEQRFEQVIGASWDQSVFPNVDQIVAANFPTDTVSLSAAGLGPTVNATRTVTITPMPSAGSPTYKVIQVRLTWSLNNRNYVVTLQGIRAPDQ